MKRYILGLLLVVLFLGACAQEGTKPIGTPIEAIDTAEPMDEPEVQVFTIGAVGPLTGDGSVYGLPVQRIADRAVADLNEQWADRNMRLEVIWEDGKCAPGPALSAAQKLVNVDGVDVIFGGVCSGETLGLAPFTDENEVLTFSTISSSPDVTGAGDFVFRNYPSDVAQVAVLVAIAQQQEASTVSIISENTDYAQAMRSGLKGSLAVVGIDVVADEVVDPEARDIRTQVTKALAAEPDAIVVIPQTIPMAGIMAKQVYESGSDIVKIGSEAIGFPDTIKEYGNEVEGFYSVRSVFENEDDPEFSALTADVECDLGFYCATTYDGIFLLGEMLEQCGDDPVCIRDALYATQDWEGPYAGPVSFDENGDVAGNFEALHIVDGEVTVV